MWLPTLAAGSDLYLITGIDMINHSSFPHKRSSSLQLVTQPLAVRCGEPPEELTLDAFFSMKAERDIAEGEQILHTYGELSDAQLLLTYGFVDIEAGVAAPPAAGNPSGQAPENPNNVAFIPAGIIADSCRALATAMGLADAAAAASHRARQELLQRLGVLQHMAVVPAACPLTDELLTAAQVGR